MSGNDTDLSSIPCLILMDRKMVSKDYFKLQIHRLRPDKPEYRRTHKKEIDEYNKNYRLTHQKGICDYNQKYRKINRNIINEKGKIDYNKLRINILSHYSNGTMSCAICGFSDIRTLTIDHINGGGTKQRKKLGFGANFYRWIKKNNYPEGFQVLCGNCNRDRKEKYIGDSSYNIKHYYISKNIIFSYYSNGTIQCNNCGDKILNHLSVDHINGGGRKDRGHMGRHFYHWLAKNKPSGFQILCENCQMIKRIENKENKGKRTMLLEVSESV